MGDNRALAYTRCFCVMIPSCFVPAVAPTDYDHIGEVGIILTDKLLGGDLSSPATNPAMSSDNPGKSSVDDSHDSQSSSSIPHLRPATKSVHTVLTSTVFVL